MPSTCVFVLPLHSLCVNHAIWERACERNSGVCSTWCHRYRAAGNGYCFRMLVIAKVFTMNGLVIDELVLSPKSAELLEYYLGEH